MSHLDEARYGRACLLVLNICPFTLRHVIKDYYTRNGSLSLQDFLEKHKHDLYHLLQKSCCCRSRHSKSTPMSRSQWDLLYIRNTSPCTKQHSRDCPCQYDAKPGVATDVMDVTLCCLVITNLCKSSTTGSAINMSHIQTIRDIRNSLVHAESANLDQTTSYDYWNRVKTAIIDLSNNVSRTLYNETFAKVQKLETRVMNSDELGELRKLIVDQKTIQDLDERVSRLEESENTKESVTESGVNRLKNSLVEMNDKETNDIPLSPVQMDGYKLSIEQLFSSVVIKEDSTDIRKRSRTAQGEDEPIEQKEVKTPEDLLNKNGKPVDKIYMLGDAAHGKTTYCLWLLKMWCNSQRPILIDRPLNEWEKALSQFDFVFHLPLRHLDPSRASVIDMICQDILGGNNALQKVAKYVLSDDKYRCFIIIDGLDEWKPNQSALNQLKYKRIPNIDNMSNCVVFTTMRSWVYSEMAEFVKTGDRLIEIKGLDDKGIKTVVGKVLEYYYEMKPSSEEYKAMHEEITGKLRDKTIASLVKIPLMAVVCVQIWCSGDKVGDSMTSFYVAMVNMMIQRAHLKHKSQTIIFETTNLKLPERLSLKKYIKNSYEALFKLGKVAYENLLSNRMKLVFPKEELEVEIGEKELMFALDVGLISQRGTHSVMEEMVSVNFFHKSVQEFLAAIYAVTEKQMIDSFCEHLSNVKVIMELSTVIMFICGLCPPLGSFISQHVVSVTDSDEWICAHRNSELYSYGETLMELCKQQLSWYRDLRDGQIYNTVPFFISDVFYYEAFFLDLKTLRIIREFLSDPLVTMRSLTCLYAPLPDAHIRSFLANTDNTRSLVKLLIHCHDSQGRSLYKVCGSSLRVLNLENVRILQPGPDNIICPPLLSDMSQLRLLSLRNITIGDRLFGLTPDMVHLENIFLIGVRMSAVCWRMFVSSLMCIEHEFYVSLALTDIYTDPKSVQMIISSIHFSTSSRISSNISYTLGDVIAFTRLWPPRSRKCVVS